MTLSSILAFLMVPMVRRQSRSRSSSPGGELEAEIDNLKRQLEDVRRDVDALIDRLTPAQTPVRHITEEMHHLMLLQSQAQVQQCALNAQNVQQMHAQAMGAQGVLQWHDCTCVPGRAATFGVLRRGDN